MSLCLLAEAWVRARGGEVRALTVDHGLRTTSACEARQVGAWLSARGIGHHVLTWTGPKPATGIQEAARAARYRLLGDWCRAAGALHLLLAHHQDDQAETVALRQARGSGAAGLAGMAAVRELTGLRLLRPLLGVPKARLLATLEAAGQPWLEDPSNLAPTFARARLRGEVVLDAPRLARAAAEQADVRADSDRRVASWLAAHARIDPAGFVTVARDALARAPHEVRRRAIRDIVRSVGGRDYPPREARLDRLLECLQAGLAGGRTLGGCRIVPWRDSVLICRERRAIADEAPVVPGAPVLWDRRFRVELSGEAPALVVRALGRAGPRALDPLALPSARRQLPAPVRPSLPSLWHGDELVAVPHLGAIRPALARTARLDVCLRPAWPLAGAPFHAGRGDETFASARREHMLGCAAVGSQSGACEGAGVGGVDRATRHLG
jgi:tRNA(Ile)-lysidine synthase